MLKMNRGKNANVTMSNGIIIRQKRVAKKKNAFGYYEILKPANENLTPTIPSNSRKASSTKMGNIDITSNKEPANNCTSSDQLNTFKDSSLDVIERNRSEGLEDGVSLTNDSILEPSRIVLPDIRGYNSAMTPDSKHSAQNPNLKSQSFLGSPISKSRSFANGSSTPTASSKGSDSPLNLKLLSQIQRFAIKRSEEFKESPKLTCKSKFGPPFSETLMDPASNKDTYNSSDDEDTTLLTIDVKKNSKYCVGTRNSMALSSIQLVSSDTIQHAKRSSYTNEQTLTELQKWGKMRDKIANALEKRYPETTFESEMLQKKFVFNRDKKTELGIARLGPPKMIKLASLKPKIFSGRLPKIGEIEGDHRIKAALL